MQIGSSLAAVSVGALVAAGLYEAGDHFLPDPITGFASYSEPVRAGEIVLVDWEIEKRTDCPGETSRIWQGQQNFHLTEPQQITSLPKGKISPSIQTKIPELAPSGELLLFIGGYYQCTGSARVSFRLGPVEFKVEG